MSQINQQQQLLVTDEPYDKDGQDWSYTYTYTGTLVDTITRTNASGQSQLRTFTYTGNLIASTSKWVNQ